MMRSQCAGVAGSQPPRHLTPSSVLTASPPGSREHIICPERMSCTQLPSPQTTSPWSFCTAVPKRSAAQKTCPFRSFEHGPWPQIVSPKISRMQLACAAEHSTRATAALTTFSFIVQPSSLSSSCRPWPAVILEPSSLWRSDFINCQDAPRAWPVVTNRNIPLGWGSRLSRRHEVTRSHFPCLSVQVTIRA